MNNNIIELVLSGIIITNLVMAASSRLLHCIKVVAVQGLLIGVLPLLMWNWSESVPHAQHLIIAVTNTLIKGIVIPILLIRTMRYASVKRELEPFINYPTSVFIVFILTIISLVVCFNVNTPASNAASLAIPTALATIATGLFIIMARKKAITQVLGFLILENGIGVFGSGIMLEYGLIVELGILLDVFVLVFIMGIAVFQINKEFSHIDADQLHNLGDINTFKE